MIALSPLIPLFPLIGFAINGFFGKRISRGLAGFVACASVLAAFILSVMVFAAVQSSDEKQNIVKVFSWITSGTLDIPFEFLLDPLSVVFLLIITGVGFLIHVYSVGYMHDDAGYTRFFTYMNLFVFFMLLLVMGNNYLITFVGWEGVGLCSYLLIGFWYKNTEYNNAAKKAFVMNRIGDLGFLLGMILIFVTFGSITYTEVFDKAGTADMSTVTAIALLLFVGAMGKSAQLPLHTWLPDAMAGPTPVSALIHAATMVTAGIFMVARSNVFYSISETASFVVALVGGVTALFAATIGLFQNDIKKILAYSTVSQLGLMFLALGVGAYSTAVFHVTTHAFFKALLFLGAGSVIHAMGGEQDIRKMGGLKDKIRITFITMLIGTIAISGIPPFSGFFSKDEILAHTYAHNKVLWMVGMITSMLTAFYMFRLLFLTFYGNFRGTHAQEHHLHESPPSMTIPLMVLAALSVIGGALGFPEFWHIPNWMAMNLEPIVKRPDYVKLDHSTEWMLMILATAGAVVSIYITWVVFMKNRVRPAESEAQLKPWQKLFYRKYFVDEIYDVLIRHPLDAASRFFWNIFDRQFIDGIVNSTGDAVKAIGWSVRSIQTGNVGFYVMGMVIGLALILLFTFVIR
jgi:NADH-quinone oxidoreductase subunit L